MQVHAQWNSTFKTIDKRDIGVHEARKSRGRNIDRLTMSAMIACVLAGAAWLLNVIGMSIDYWLYYSIGDKSVNLGLWKVCGIDGKCYAIDNPSSALEATRAFEIMGMLGIFAAAACAIWMHRKMEMTLISKIGAALALAAGCAMLLGCIIFAAKVKEDESTLVDLTLHAGFALCIIASFVSFGAAGVMFKISM